MEGENGKSGINKVTGAGELPKLQKNKGATQSSSSWWTIQTYQNIPVVLLNFIDNALGYEMEPALWSVPSSICALMHYVNECLLLELVNKVTSSERVENRFSTNCKVVVGGDHVSNNPIQIVDFKILIIWRSNHNGPKRASSPYLWQLQKAIRTKLEWRVYEQGQMNRKLILWNTIYKNWFSQ